MGELLVSGLGGGGTSSDELTATRYGVLKHYTAVTKDSNDEPAEGLMPDRREPDPAIGGVTADFPNIGIHKYEGTLQIVTPTNQKEKWIAVSPKEGFYQSASSYVGVPRAELSSAIGLTPQKIAYQQTILGITGTYTGAGTANQEDVLAGKTFSAGQNGNSGWYNAPGTMPNRGAVNQALNAGGSYVIPKGYHNGSGKVTANSLASQTGGATAADGDVRSGKTYWKDGAKRTGTMVIQSAISFSAAALSPTTIRISWKNPAKGPWQGVFIQMSTSGNPGTGGGSRVYTGAGTNPNQANGSNYVDIGGLAANTQYYFTCTSYCDALGWGSSHNVGARTQQDTIEKILTSVPGYGVNWAGQFMWCMNTHCSNDYSYDFALGEQYDGRATKLNLPGVTLLQFNNKAVANPGKAGQFQKPGEEFRCPPFRNSGGNTVVYSSYAISGSSGSWLNAKGFGTDRVAFLNWTSKNVPSCMVKENNTYKVRIYLMIKVANNGTANAESYCQRMVNLFNTFKNVYIESTGYAQDDRELTDKWSTTIRTVKYASIPDSVRLPDTDKMNYSYATGWFVIVELNKLIRGANGADSWQDFQKAVISFS